MAIRRYLDHVEVIVRQYLQSTESGLVAAIDSLQSRLTTEIRAKLGDQLRKQLDRIFAAIGATTAILSLALRDHGPRVNNEQSGRADET